MTMVNGFRLIVAAVLMLAVPAFAGTPLSRFQFNIIRSSARLPSLESIGDLRFECDATNGPVILTLPTAVLNGTTYIMIKADRTANACTFATTAGQTMDDAPSKSLTTQWATMSVSSDNANWRVDY